MKKLLLLLLLIPALTFAQDDWKFTKEKDGIKVWTKEVPGSNFKAFRGQAVLNCKLSAVVAVFHDLSGYPNLFPDCSYSELLSMPDEQHHTHYLQFSAPWPVTDRDAAYENTYTYDPATKTLTVIGRCKPNAKPKDGDYIRIPKGDVHWTFTDNGNGTVTVDYNAHPDPGGSIPAWLANSTAVDQPMGTLTNLRKRVQDSKYTGKSYGFLN